jgi:TolA-binding protein
MQLHNLFLMISSRNMIIKLLDKSNLIYADAIYYKALCEKETASPEAEKDLQFFADNFKGHPKTNNAYFHLGDLAYAKQIIMMH